MWELMSHLLPKFELIAEPGFQIKELGVWFWLLMIAITAWSVFAVFYHRLRFSLRLSRVQQLIDGQDRTALAQNRKATLDKALEDDPKVTGALWREFDESLVYSSDKTRLSNTLDAEHFFNSVTLAYGLTASRLLAAAPSFLTAIGVLGTFIGLTLGLNDLHVSADDIDKLKSGVSTMINGAAVAFMTSVWGVGLSLFLNVFEKLVERGALSKIRHLQQNIDFLYPRIPAEQSLVQIAAATDESKEALQDLHERIGDRLQETVSGMSDSMQQAFTDALNNVMAPAIQTLANNASKQSTEVLEKLVTNFMDGMKSTGHEQGALMQGAAGDVRTALSNMGQQMETLFKRLDEQQNKSREHTAATSQEFSNLLEQQRVDATQRQEQMEIRFSQLMEQLSRTVSEQFNKADEVEQKRTQMQEGLVQQFEQQQVNSRKQAESVSHEFAQQLELQSISANKRQEQLEIRFSQLMEQLSRTVSEQFNKADKVEQQRIQVQDGLLKQFEQQQVNSRKQAESISHEFARQLELQSISANKRQEEMEQRFNQLMEQLSLKVGEQFNKAGEVEQQRIQVQEGLLKQFEQQQVNSREQAESVSHEFAQQLELQSISANKRQEEMEQRFNQLMEQLSLKIGEQFVKTAEVDRQRSLAQEASQQQLQQGFNHQLTQFGMASADQISAIKDVSVEQQTQLSQTFEVALAGLNGLIANHVEAASERERKLENRFRNQVDQLANEQQQLLSAVTEGTQKVQQQMAQMAEQHRLLMGELSNVTGSVESSSQHMDNSSTQLGMLSTNLKQVTDVLDTRLQAVTESLEGTSHQTSTLAEQVAHQADTLAQLQQELSQATVHFEKAAESADHGFQAMNKHQQAFLDGINQEFQTLGNSLEQQVEAIEKQADEWLRSYSSEVHMQVSERMEQWNSTTLQFADEMRRTVSAISGIVDDLEQKR